MAKGGGADVGATKRGKGMKIMAIVDRHGLPLSASMRPTNPRSPSRLELENMITACRGVGASLLCDDANHIVWSRTAAIMHDDRDLGLPARHTRLITFKMTSRSRTIQKRVAISRNTADGSLRRAAAIGPGFRWRIAIGRQKTPLNLAFGFGGLVAMGRLLTIGGLYPDGWWGCFCSVDHARFEGFDALGNVPHHFRNLTTSAEHKKDYYANNQPVPDAKKVHQISLYGMVFASPPVWFELGIGGVKRKCDREKLCYCAI
jgi:hypothetical protein